MDSVTGRRVSRRGFLAAAAGVAVVGYNAAAGRWVSTAEAATETAFQKVPPLTGSLVTDSGTRAANSTDAGHMSALTPRAVLFPGTAEDVRVMVAFCARNRIPVATNTGRNSVFGQTLTAGLAVNARSLATIHSISPEGADVDAGVLWYDLIGAAFEHGLTPPSITGYTQLGVAGTLSIGGLGAATTNREVAQAASVRKLQVVTGAGDLVECSPTRNSRLFKAMLAGQGQCGVIVRATVGLVPAPRFARMYRSAPYTDVAACLDDLRLLAQRGSSPGGFDFVASANNPGAPDPLPLGLLGCVFFDDPATVPPTSTLMRGCSPTARQAQYVDLPYLDYVYLVDRQVDGWRAGGGWDALVKPWFNALIPDSGMTRFARSVIPALTAEDLSPTTFLILSPFRTSGFTDDFPLFRAPSPASGPWGWLCGILTNSAEPAPDPGFASRMLERNRRWWEHAVALGGSRYVEDAVPFSKADWRTHFGPVFPQFAAWKREFDPYGIMTPGAGIF